MATVRIRPAADGFYHDQLIPIPSTSDYWIRINEDPNSADDGDTSYIYDSGAGAGCNFQPVFRLSSTNSLGTSRTPTSSYASYSEIMDKPGGGSWAQADLNTLEFGWRMIVGVTTKYETYLGLSTDIDDIPAGSTINSIKSFVVAKCTGKLNEVRVTQIFIEVDYTSGGADVTVTPSAVTVVASTTAPTVVTSTLGVPYSLEADYQTNPTNVSQNPIFTALYEDNGLTWGRPRPASRRLRRPHQSQPSPSIAIIIPLLLDWRLASCRGMARSMPSAKKRITLSGS